MLRTYVCLTARSHPVLWYLLLHVIGPACLCSKTGRSLLLWHLVCPQDEAFEEIVSEASHAGSRPASAAAGEGTPVQMRRSHEASLALLFCPPLASDSDGFCGDQPPLGAPPGSHAIALQPDPVPRRVGKKLLLGEGSLLESPCGSAAIRAHYAPTPFTQAGAGGFNPRVSGQGSARADAPPDSRSAQQEGSQSTLPSQAGWQQKLQQAPAAQRASAWNPPLELDNNVRQQWAGAAKAAGRRLRDSADSSGDGLLPTPPRRGTMKFPSSREGTPPGRQLFSGGSSRRSTRQQHEGQQGIGSTIPP